MPKKIRTDICPTNHDAICDSLAARPIEPKCPGIALDQLELHNLKAEAGNYNWKPAVRVDALPDAANGASYAILKGLSDFARRQKAAIRKKEPQGWRL
jgi:hypothetical protein